MLFVAAGRELLRTTAFQPREFPFIYLFFFFLLRKLDGRINIVDGHSSIWSGQAIMVCEKSEYSSISSVNIANTRTTSKQWFWFAGRRW
jgi:hypothetical protein